MNASAAAFVAAFAFSAAGMAGDIKHPEASPEPVQARLLSPNIGRVEVCNLTVEGSTSPCQSFDARQLEALLVGTQSISAQAGQVAFVDPETQQPVAPTQDQLSDLQDLAFSEETQPGNNEQLVTEILADGTMMVRVGNRFHARLTVVRIEETSASSSMVEAVNP